MIKILLSAISIVVPCVQLKQSKNNNLSIGQSLGKDFSMMISFSVQIQCFLADRAQIEVTLETVLRTEMDKGKSLQHYV